MPSHDLPRRPLLSLGAGLAAAFVAGCSSDDKSPDGGAQTAGTAARPKRQARSAKEALDLASVRVGDVDGAVVPRIQASSNGLVGVWTCVSECDSTEQFELDRVAFELLGVMASDEVGAPTSMQLGVVVTSSKDPEKRSGNVEVGLRLPASIEQVQQAVGVGLARVERDDPATMEPLAPGTTRQLPPASGR